MILFYSWWLNPTDLCFVGFDLTDTMGQIFRRWGTMWVLGVYIMIGWLIQKATGTWPCGRVLFSVDDVKCERWLKVVTVPNWKWGGIRVLCACLVGWLVVAATFTPSMTCETLKQNMEISITYYVYYNLYFICTYFSFHSRKVSDLCRHARCNDYRIWK